MSVIYPKRTHCLCLIGCSAAADIKNVQICEWKMQGKDKESPGFTKYPESKQENSSKAKTGDSMMSQFRFQSCTFPFGIESDKVGSILKDLQKFFCCSTEMVPKKPFPNGLKLTGPLRVPMWFNELSGKTFHNTNFLHLDYQ